MLGAAVGSGSPVCPVGQVATSRDTHGASWSCTQAHSMSAVDPAHVSHPLDIHGWGALLRQLGISC